MSGGFGNLNPSFLSPSNRIFDAIGVNKVFRKAAAKVGFKTKGDLADPLGVLTPPEVPKIPAPSPTPQRDDPAVVEARKQGRLSGLRRKGRSATIVGGITKSAPVSQPRAGSKLLG